MFARASAIFLSLVLSVFWIRRPSMRQSSCQMPNLFFLSVAIGGRRESGFPGLEEDLQFLGVGITTILLFEFLHEDLVEHASDDGVRVNMNLESRYAGLRNRSSFD